MQNEEAQTGFVAGMNRDQASACSGGMTLLRERRAT